MERDKKRKVPKGVLAKRGMSVCVCPLGTGLVIHQAESEAGTFTAHLTLTEARELASALVVAIHNARESMVGLKSVSSLFVQGLRIDQIASELCISKEEVRAELIARGLIKPDNSESSA